MNNVNFSEFDKVESDVFFVDSCPADQLDLAEFAVVNTRAVWSELYALMEHPKALAALEEAVRRWISDNGLIGLRGWERLLVGPWQLDLALEGTHPAPWELTTSDGWVMEVDRRVEEALEDNDADAVLAYHGFEVAQAASDRGADPTLVERLKAMSHDAYKQFGPQPEEGPEWWTPMHSCFWFNEVAAVLGQLWKPAGKWVAIEGRGHAFAADLDNRLILDFLWRPEWEEHPYDLLAKPATGEADDSAKEPLLTERSDSASESPPVRARTVTLYPPEAVQHS